MENTKRNVTESKSIYRCMLCKKEYDELPSNAICDVCGMPMNIQKHDFHTCGLGAEILIKVSNPYVINSMRKGEFWFQSPKYYQDYSGNDAIGDPWECAFEQILDVPLNEIEKYTGIKQGTHISYRGKTYILEKVYNGMVYVSSLNQNNYRFICFYKLFFDEHNNLILPDEQIKKFGTHFTIVKDRSRLNQIIGEYVDSADYDLAFVPTDIAYLSNGYRGIYTPGCKFEKYSYQNEYRLILASTEYSKLPEKKEKVIRLDKVADEDLLSPPIPINVLWDSSTLDDFLNRVERELSEEDI